VTLYYSLIDCIVLIYSAVQLQVCLINLLAYLLMTESVQNLAHLLTSALDKAAIARILHGLVTVME